MYNPVHPPTKLKQRVIRRFQVWVKKPRNMGFYIVMSLSKFFSVIIDKRKASRRFSLFVPQWGPPITHYLTLA